jgi:5-methylcytosine-specific restriction endonuclease McrA
MNILFNQAIEKYHSRCKKLTKKKLYNKLMGAKSRWAKQNDCNLEEMEVFIVAGLGYCPYCLGELDVKNMSLDHKTPIDRGGDKHIDNLIICCLRCNRCKGVLTENEYRKLLQFISTFKEDVVRNYILRKLSSKDMWGGKIARNAKKRGGLTK